MKSKKLIDALGGCQETANILNEANDLFVHTRQRIFNWYKKDSIPPWAQITYEKIWKKATKLLTKSQMTK
jgi:hypothetical protein